MMAQKSSSLKIILINLNLVIVLLAVSFVGAEWLLRLYIPDTDHKGMNELAPAPLYYRIIPNFQGVLEGVKVSVNSDGYRDSEFDRQRPENRKLVAIIGDSITFGQGVPQGKTFPAVLETLLNSSTEKHEYRVWNLGVPGYNTHQEYEVFNSLVLPQKPYWIFLAYIVNDVEPINEGALRIIGGEKPQDHASWISRQLDESLVIYLARNRLGQMIRMFKPDYHGSSYIDDTIRLYEGPESPWNSVSKTIESMKLLSDGKNIRFTVVMIPSMMDFERYPFEKINTLLESFCKKKGIDFLDVLPYFRGQNPSSLHVSMIDSHPNEFAYRIIAGAIADHMAKSVSGVKQD